MTVEAIQEFQPCPACPEHSRGEHSRRACPQRSRRVGYCSVAMLSPALRYLRSDPAHAEGVGLLRRQDGRTWEFFAGRIIFVERNRAGRVIHVAGRALDGKARLKYLFLPGLPRPVYGLARFDPSRPVFVVEGFFDYITLRQWGYQAVATLGTSIKEKDAVRLGKSEDVVYVADNNAAGLHAAARWREAIGRGRVLQLPRNVEDANDLAQEEGGEGAFHKLVEEPPMPVYGLVLPATTGPLFVVWDLADCATLWEWGFQGVAVQDVPIGNGADDIAARESLYYVDGPGVRQWREEIGRGSVVRLPEGADSIADLAKQQDGQERFRRWAMELV